MTCTYSFEYMKFFALQQESYHRHRVRAGIPSMYKPLATVLQSLETFLRTRSTEAMQSTAASMVDIPCGAWSPTFRREAEQYIAGQHYMSEQDAAGNVYIAMRRDVAALPHAQRHGRTNSDGHTDVDRDGEERERVMS